MAMLWGCCSWTALAASGVYKGTLMPEPHDQPIPIEIELESGAGGTLSGKVKTAAPFSREGRITTGEKMINTCKIEVDFGNETMRLEGGCPGTSFDGYYVLSAGKSRRGGIFRLARLQQEKGLSESERRRLSEAADAVCFKENTNCLLACPRGDFNAEFLCANNCRSKRDACNARTKQMLEGKPSSVN